MAAGPNFLLDKGYLYEGTSAVTFGIAAVHGTAEQSAKIPTVANTHILGVFYESLDAAKAAANPGKIVLQVRKLGIARAVAGGVFAKSDPVVINASGRFIKQTVAGGPVNGFAEDASTGDGFLFELFLTPGATL